MTCEPEFPDELQTVAATVLRALAPAEEHPTHQGPRLQVQSQTLSMPSRVYYTPARLLQLIDHSSGDERAFALCLGTRHWDGFIREECLRKLIHIDRPWVAPFVVQLIGEYVIEIIEVVVSALDSLNPATYKVFALQNPAFMATTLRRVTSYWDCYHRRKFPRLSDYPGHVAMKAIMGMSEDPTRREV